jgi:TonB family protein
MKTPKFIVPVLMWLIMTAPFALPTKAQSGAAGARLSGRQYGVNLTYAVYQYDAMRSTAIEDTIRLSGTYSTADDEIAHIKEKYHLEDVVARHVRSVGLRSQEAFNDAVLLGPEYMVFLVTPHEIVRGHMKFDITVRYANQTMIEAKGIEIDSYETILLKGGKGMFGVKYFVGAGGKQESAPMERTLLVSVTPAIVPLASLRDRPGQLSQPVDQYGSPLRTSESDRFTPPVPIDRVVPKFESTRGVRGSVRLAGIVTPEGKITNVKVVRGVDPIIDERAVEAFRQYTFSPGTLNGKPVHATYSEEIVFAPPPPSTLELQMEIERQKRKEKEKKPLNIGQ